MKQANHPDQLHGQLLAYGALFATLIHAMEPEQRIWCATQLAEDATRARELMKKQNVISELTFHGFDQSISGMMDMLTDGQTS